MIIVSAADERFVPHFATLLHSVWTHEPNAQVHLLDCGIAPATLATLANFANGLGIALAIIPIETTPFADLTKKTWSAAIYARLLIPDLFPTAERALYLDADCLVVGNLTDLWRTDLGEAAIGGVYDYVIVKERRVGIALSTYVNSGMLLMNLPVWRRERLSAAAFTFLRAHPTVGFPDQTAINAACAGRTCYLRERWNFFLGGTSHRVGDWVEPRIIHYAAPAKPWLHRDAFLGELYRCHRRRTPFPLTEPRAAYRSKARVLLNMLIGRRKYWYRFLIGPRARAFVEAYLAAHSVRPDQPVVSEGRLPNSLARIP